MNPTAAKALLEQALSWDRARELVVRPAKRASGAAAGVLPAPLQERPPVLQTSPADFKTVALGLPVGDTRSFTLPNGLQVVLSRRTEVPLASVSLTLPLGARHVSRSTEFWVPLVLDWRINNDAMNRVGAPVLSMNADTTTVHDAELSTQLPVLIDWLGHFLRPSTNSTPIIAKEYTQADQNAKRPSGKYRRGVTEGLTSCLGWPFGCRSDA